MKINIEYNFDTTFNEIDVTINIKSDIFIDVWKKYFNKKFIILHYGDLKRTIKDT